LVGFDGSEDGRLALRWALLFARPQPVPDHRRRAAELVAEQADVE
jgi:hypothetical protein